MAAAVRYYVDALGFDNAEWGSDYFTCVSRGGAAIYLANSQQGPAGAWVWIGVADAEEVYRELQAKGATILHGPANYPWALEIRVADPDGNVLRMGSDPRTDRPYDDWKA
jgi:predicted enzyme related to lactoylglutathione lyase